MPKIVANSLLRSSSNTKPATFIAPSTYPNSHSKNAAISLRQSSNSVNFTPSQRSLCYSLWSKNNVAHIAGKRPIHLISWCPLRIAGEISKKYLAT